MAVFTPRGLKIRFPVNYCFALIVRLYPDVDAFKVLKTTEGIELIPTMISFITALTCFVMHLEPFQIGLYTFVAFILGYLVTFFGFFAIPFLTFLATWFSYLSGFGIYLIVLIIAGFLLVGWKGVLAYFVGKYSAAIIKQVIDFSYAKRTHTAFGLPIFASERNFINAYRLHASELGKSIDVDVSDEELEEENWKEAFDDLAYKWPEVVSRFTE